MFGKLMIVLLLNRKNGSSGRFKQGRTFWEKKEDQKRKKGKSTLDILTCHALLGGAPVRQMVKA